jgi:hypothetical protein
MAWYFCVILQGVFQLQKKTIRIMMGFNSRSSSLPVFRALKILTVAAQYILSLMIFQAYNLEYLTFNNLIYSICTRRRLQLHRSQTNLASGQKGEYYTSIKISNILLKHTADLMKDKTQLSTNH